MALNPEPQRPIGRRVTIPPCGAQAPLSVAGMSLPHERDQAPKTTADAPDPMMVQAKRDIDAGMVDTDMRATPGLDAKHRDNLVPGPGGKQPPGRS